MHFADYARGDRSCREPVLIAGAGPVGLTAALELARHGIPTQVIDKNPGLQAAGSRGIVLQRATLEVFERNGAQEILERGLVPHRRRTFFGDTELFSSEFPAVAEGALPLFVNLQQDVTERVLLEAASKRADLITLLWNHEVVGLEQHADRVALTVKDDSREKVLSSPFVFACDGCRSQLRKLVGADFPGYTDTSSFLIVDVQADLGSVKEHRFTFAPDSGQGQTQLIVPQPDDVWRIDWQLFPGQDAQTELQSGALHQRLKQTLGTKTAAKIVWSSCYKFHQRLMDMLVHGRVLFMGDSAHLVAPFGARGMNSGVQDAENAAWKIARVLSLNAPPSLVNTYHEERHAAGLENQRITRATMRFISPQTPEERRQRDEVLHRSAREPDVRSLVDSGRMSTPMHYVQSSLLQGDHPLVGSRLPDVRLASGEWLRSRIPSQGVVLTAATQHAAAHITHIPVGAEAANALGLHDDLCAVVRPDHHIAAVVPVSNAEQATNAMCQPAI